MAFNLRLNFDQKFLTAEREETSEPKTGEEHKF